MHFSPFISDYCLISCQFLLLDSSLHLIHVQGLEHYSCFSLLFHSLECVTLDTKICRNMVLKKICQPLQWLGTFNEQPAKQIEIQVHIFSKIKKVSYCCNTAHVQWSVMHSICMNDACIWCAHEVRQHYLCIMIRLVLPWQVMLPFSFDYVFNFNFF